MLTFERIQGTQLLERVREAQDLYHEIPFMRTDDLIDFWGSKPFEAHNLYIVAFEDSIPVGAIKFYRDLPGKKEHLNEFLAREGIPEIQGRLFHGSYIGVHPAYRRKGIGAMLNNHLAKELRPGDVFVFSSHEPDGAKLNAQWFSQMGGDIQIIHAHNYYGYREYDPSKKNFIVSDPNQFKSLQRIIAHWTQ